MQANAALTGPISAGRYSDPGPTRIGAAGLHPDWWQHTNTSTPLGITRGLPHSALAATAEPSRPRSDRLRGLFLTQASASCTITGASLLRFAASGFAMMRANFGLAARVDFFRFWSPKCHAHHRRLLSVQSHPEQNSGGALSARSPRFHPLAPLFALCHARQHGRLHPIRYTGA